MRPRDVTDRPPAEVLPARSRDLGLLFVHGIGGQARGETLTTWSDAIMDFLAKDLGISHVRTGTAFLTPDPDDSGAPAYMDVEVTLPGQESPASWRIAEGWWAQVFGPPSFRELAVWAFLSLPYTILAHFVISFRRAWSGTRRHSAVRVMRVAFAAASVMFAVLIAPAVSAVVGLVLLVGALPIPRLRSIAGAVQRALSQSAGDSYVLLSSPTRASAIVHAVHRDVAWLSAGTTSLIVVAHSQGAEVAYRALSRSRPDNLAHFVTLGSGQSKLTMVEAAVRTGRTRGIWLAPAGALVAALSLFRGIDTWIHEGPDGAWGILIYVMLGIGWCAAGIAQASPLAGARGDAVAVLGSQEWLDLYASHDPVPNGPPAGGASSTPESREVRNRASVLRDHTAYVRNAEQVVSTIVELAVRTSPATTYLTDFDATGARHVAALRRSWRVSWLRLSKWACALAGLAVFAPYVFDRRSPATLPQGLLRLVDRVPYVDLPTRWSDNPEATLLVGLVSAVVFGLAAYVVLASIWWWWDKQDHLDLGSTTASAHRFPLWVPGFVALLEALVLLAALTTILVKGERIALREELSTGDVTALVVLPAGVLLLMYMLAIPLLFVLRLLVRLGVVDEGRSVPTVRQQLAVMVPYLVVLSAYALLTLPAPGPPWLWVTLAITPFPLALLGGPLLTSREWMKRALMPLRARAYAPPVQPPTTDRLIAEGMLQHLEAAVAPAPSGPEEPREEEESWDVEQLRGVLEALRDKAETRRLKGALQSLENTLDDPEATPTHVVARSTTALESVVEQFAADQRPRDRTGRQP